MPDPVDDCAKSVMDDNPDYSESRAYAICWAQENKGNLGLEDDATHDDMLEAVANADLQEQGGCPEGQIHIDGQCVDYDEVDDVPPGALDLSSPRILSHRQLAGALERIEQDDGTVRYTDLKILSEGVWTDAASKQPTHYAPENLEVDDDNTVNIFHDADNEVSAVGYIDPESTYLEDGDLYADVVLHMENAASEYADENLRQSLETNGKQGFGGPSVEIPPEGLDISERGELGYPKTEAGVIDGLGLVKNPASKPTSFAQQASNRQVALADGRKDKALLLQKRSMSPDEIREILDNYGFEGLDEMSDEDVLEVASDLHEDLTGELAPDDGEGENGDEEGAEAEKGEEEDDEDEEDEEKEMQDEAIDVIQEQIDDLWDAIDEMKDSAMTEEEMSEELESARDELAAAETVAELEDAREELDKRLSAIEEQDGERKTLADGEEKDWEPTYDTNVSSSSGW